MLECKTENWLSKCWLKQKKNIKNIQLTNSYMEIWIVRCFSIDFPVHTHNTTSCCYWILLFCICCTEWTRVDAQLHPPMWYSYRAKISLFNCLLIDAIFESQLFNWSSVRGTSHNVDTASEVNWTNRTKNATHRSKKANIAAGQIKTKCGHSENNHNEFVDVKPTWNC